MCSRVIQWRQLIGLEVGGGPQVEATMSYAGAAGMQMSSEVAALELTFICDHSQQEGRRQEDFLKWINNHTQKNHIFIIMLCLKVYGAGFSPGKTM